MKKSSITFGPGQTAFMLIGASLAGIIAAGVTEFALDKFFGVIYPDSEPESKAEQTPPPPKKKNA